MTREEANKQEIEKKIQETDLLTREYADEQRADILENKRHSQETDQEEQ